MPAVPLLQISSAVLLNIGFAWLVGSWFARCWMRSSAVAHEHFEPALRKLDLLAAAISMTGGAAALLGATAVMAGVGLREAGPMFWTMVSTTSYGHAGCGIIAAMAVIVLVRSMGATGRASDMAVILLLAVFSSIRASMGHAGEEGFWSIAQSLATIHFFAIGLWTGAVIVSGWFVLHEMRARQFVAGAADTYLTLMSQTAMLAVVAIVVTGIYSAWYRVGSSEHLVHTTYGITLLVKVATVLLAIALGGYNKFVGLPAASRSSRGITLVRVVLQAETLLLLGALFAAAILTNQQPPTAM